MLIDFNAGLAFREKLGPSVTRIEFSHEFSRRSVACPSGVNTVILRDDTVSPYGCKNEKGGSSVGLGMLSVKSNREDNTFGRVVIGHKQMLIIVVRLVMRDNFITVGYSVRIAGCSGINFCIQV